jgi:hypothetical protein
MGCGAAAPNRLTHDAEARVAPAFLYFPFHERTTLGFCSESHVGCSAYQVT